MSNIEKAAQTLLNASLEWADAGGDLNVDGASHLARALAEAGLLAPEAAAVDVVEEWALHCGEGLCDDLYDVYATRSAANEAWTSIRENIASGEWEAEDYEPVKIYHRTLTTFVSEWALADE